MMPGVGFQKEWLNDPSLKDWIVPVSNSHEHVYCRFCEQVYRAHKCDLTTHTSREKHKRNVREKKEKGLYNSSSFDVKVVTLVNKNSSVGDHDSEEENFILYDSNANAHRLSLACNTAKGKNSYSYCKHWELNPMLKEWIQPVVDDITKACCGPCNLTMCAKLFTLTSHAKTSRHRTSMDALVAATSITNSATNSNQEFRDNEENLGANNLVKASICNGKVLVDHNNSNGFEVKEESMDMEMKDISSYTPSPNRPKLDTSMFLEAITNGEFSNEELLKIAQCALGQMVNK